MSASLYDNNRDFHNNRANNKEFEKRKEDLQIKLNENEILENLKNLVGPSFILCKYFINKIFYHF